MVKKITFFAKIIGLTIILCNFSYSQNLKIIPLKKPQLNEVIKEKKVSINIIKLIKNKNFLDIIFYYMNL